MKTIITITLILCSIGVSAQTTTPVKDKKFIEKITTFKRKGGIVHHYDIYFTPVINGNASLEVWVVSYKKRWYSNYPYTVIAKNNKYRIYKNGHCIYTQIINKPNPINLNLKAI